MTSIEFRELAVEDIDLVSQLDKEFPDRSGRGGISENVDAFIEFTPRLTEAGAIGLVAVADGTPVGYGMVMPRQGPRGTDRASDSMVLTHVAVLPAHRRAGTGRALVGELANRARRRGAALIFAHVPSNTRSFYESAGWTVTAPGDGLAWIEPPTVRLWDDMRAGGAPVDARKKMAMLRHDGAEEDTKYPCMAYIVLEPKKIDLLYTFPRNVTPPVVRPYLKLAEMCLNRAVLFAELPADVSQTVELFIQKMAGPERLAELKRTRRGRLLEARNHPGR